jgi:hypothetical protein
MKLIHILLGTVALALTPALAMADLLPRQAGAVSYVCGGVGQAEQQEIKAAAPRYDMMLTFAVSNGSYLADVDVEIKDRRGAVVLSARCDGPLMLVDLPANGTYRVTAQANGQVRQKTVTAGASGRPSRAVFVWPAG